MMWKDEVTCLCTKMFIQEKEVYLQQELHANLLIGYHVTSDDQIRKCNPAATPCKQGTLQNDIN